MYFSSSRALLMISVTAAAFAAASCTQVKSGATLELAISTTAGLRACKAETDLACLKPRVQNTGSKKVAIALEKPGQPLLHEMAAYLEGQRADGEWREAGGNSGSYIAPDAFIEIEPGREAEVVFDVGDDLRNYLPYLSYRVVLIVNSTEKVYSPPLDLGPRCTQRGC